MDEHDSGTWQWLELRGGVRGALQVVSGLLLLALGAIALVSVLWAWWPGANAVVANVAGVAISFLQLRIGTTATQDGVLIRADFHNRRVRWDEILLIDTDAPGKWGTGVLARTTADETFRLRGVRPEELEQVRACWQRAVGNG